MTAAQRRILKLAKLRQRYNAARSSHRTTAIIHAEMVKITTRQLRAEIRQDRGNT